MEVRMPVCTRGKRTHLKLDVSKSEGMPGLASGASFEPASTGSSSGTALSRREDDLQRVTRAQIRSI